MATIVTRVTGATAKNAPLTSAELDTNFINLNTNKLETSWTGSTNLVTLGTVATGTWNATTISTGKGGTGLTTFTSGGALYATSASALTTGTLPVTAGGTGVTTSTGTGSNVLSTSPTLVTPTLGVAAATSLTTSGDITVGGNLIVNGTTTTINSTTITVDDKNIELGSVATPTNTTADGGGITLKGATDKTFNWVNATSAWTSSEHIDLAAGKSVYLRGATSGTVVLAVPAVAGTTTITFPATTGTVVTTGDIGTVTSTMIADGTIVNADISASAAIAVSKLAASTISGITLGNNLNTLTMNVSGTGLSGSATYNGSAAATFTVTSNATSANTASTVVARDASGNFTAGAITAALTGNASTATTLQTARTINGVSFNGSANITVTADASTLTGTVLKSTVVSSSLTSVGTIATGTWNATNISLNTGGTNASLTAAAGGIVYSTASAMAITSVGTAGQVLTSNGTSAPSWATFNALPSQTGNVGKYLTTDGSTASWATISAGITVSDDISTNASYYPALMTATSGSRSSAKVSSTSLYFNPSTGTLNATVFNSLSDATQKTNTVKIENATSTLNKIDGFEFDWVDNGKHSAGVIAQKLEEILPFLVDTNENGVKSVNYAGLIAYLIESNKELSKRIEVLENK